VINHNRPCHRSILAIDVEDSATRNNSAKAHMRDAMYDLVTETLASTGVSEQDHDPFIDRGDGILVLLHPTEHVPKTLLLHKVIPKLSQSMTLHNLCFPTDGFRLRAVLHAGEVLYDSRGPFGEALDHAFRLLDAPQTKRALRRSTTPLMLVVSDDFYLATVRDHQHGRPNSLIFNPFDVNRNAGVRGWLHVPPPAARGVRPAGHLEPPDGGRGILAPRESTACP
jgi:hypothetical protein